MERKLIHGVAENDLKGVSSRKEKINGRWVTVWVCPAYRTWRSMLDRCYSSKYQSRCETYKGCNVSEDWLKFSNFKRWFEFNYKEGLQLDKDLLVEDNKTYSGDTCIFITGNLNRFLTLNNKNRGEYPLGVYSHTRDGFRSKCGGEELGRFKDPVLAHRAWQSAKRNQAIYLQSQQTCERTKQGLQRIIDKLQHHIDNNIEIKDL